MTSYGSNFTAVYREDGLRAWKQTSSSKTCFYYGGGEPIFETDGSGNLTAINVFAPDGLVAREGGGTWTQYSFDPQGNVDNRLDSSGNVLSSPIFDSYGAGTSVDVFGYNGQWGYYRDLETGLHLLGLRYYDSGAGRFLNPDPTGFDGGINLYSYAYGKAVGAEDSSGMMAVEVLSLVHSFLGNNQVPPAPPGYCIQNSIDWINLAMRPSPPYMVSSLPESGFPDPDNLVGQAIIFGSFYKNFKTGGVWDFKGSHHPEWAPFGNFNWALMAAAGFSEADTLQFADIYARRTHHQPHWDDQNPGKIVYDENIDRHWIRTGWLYFHSHYENRN